jgi:hypothetical protein
MKMRYQTHTLDDWFCGVPDAWDYMAVLRTHKVELAFEPPFGWSLSWDHGVIGIGLYGERDLAHKAAALFIELWLRGVSASFAVKLMEGYILRERS